MKNSSIALLTLAVLFLSDSSATAQPRGRGPRRGEVAAGRYGWLSSLEAGKVQARQSGKPLMVVIRCVP